ncbi:MAG: pyridoxal phosphate-dependent aminotransferase [Firmicutes bacterium]|nr:pyridoxal phosphate-dependent aminotransferase [Bacillota bacterium]
MLKELAHRVQRIKPSQTLAVAARAEELTASGKDIISLSVGEPDFDTPDFIKQAAIEAINQGLTKYTAVDGTAGLKRAIIQKLARDNQLHFEANQILVSCGAKHSLYNLFAAILNPSDEVIIPAPYWVSYPDIAKLVDAEPVIIKADASQSFKISPAQLDAAITPATRLVVLNSPCNPTGMAYTKAELQALGAVLAKHPNVMIVSDDIYEHTLWSKEPFCNIVMACPDLYDRTIIVNGVSKSYAMTGWRIGYAAGNAKIIAAMKKIQSQSTSNACSISQAAAEAALNGDQTCSKEMTLAYKERHDYIIEACKSIPGIQCMPCDGTFYLFLGVEELIKNTSITNDIDFAEFLLANAEIAVVPGTAFGAPNYIRISYATSMEKIKEAMKRMKKAISEIR